MYRKMEKKVVVYFNDDDSLFVNDDREVLLNVEHINGDDIEDKEENITDD